LIKSRESLFLALSIGPAFLVASESSLPDFANMLDEIARPRLLIIIDLSAIAKRSESKTLTHHL